MRAGAELIDDRIIQHCPKSQFLKQIAEQKQKEQRDQIDLPALRKFLNGSKKYGRCAVCGNDEIRLLNASHITPWRDCDDNEKTELNNGLLLCPAHDRCFDLG